MHDKTTRPRTRLPPAGSAWQTSFNAVYSLINLGLIAALPVLGAAVTNSFRDEHDCRPAARKVPLPSPPGAAGG